MISSSHNPISTLTISLPPQFPIGRHVPGGLKLATQGEPSAYLDICPQAGPVRSNVISTKLLDCHDAARMRYQAHQGVSCVDGPRLARDHLACSTEVACSHVSGLLVQSGWTAGPDGVREPSPHHSNGIDVPMKSQVWLGCVGSTDCAITRHCSLASF